MHKIHKFLPSSGKFLGFMAGITASIFWGFHPVVIRYLTGQGISPLSIAALRLLIGSSSLALVSLCFDILRKKKAATHETGNHAFQYNKFFWFGVIGLTCNFFLFHLGLKYTIASNAILLEAFSPVVVLLLVTIFLPKRLGNMARNPHLLRNILLIVLAGSIGSSLLIVNQPKTLFVPREIKLIGDLIEFSAMFFFALYLLSAHEYQQRTSHQSALRTTSHFLFFCGLLTVLFVPWHEFTTYTQTQWLWILILSIFSTSLSYALWQFASKYLDVVPLALLFGLSSIFNVAIEAFVFHLDISGSLLIGAGLILASSFTTQWLMSKHKTPLGEINDNPLEEV